MRKLYPLVLALFGLSLAGCFSDSGDPGPKPATGSTGIEDPIGITPDDVPTGFYASFDPTVGLMPYPNDILGFLADPDTDGTLNLPASSLPFQVLASEVNKLDGFSTFGRITANFSEGIAASSLDPAVNPLNAYAVVMIQVLQDPATKAVIGVAGPPMTPGVDFSVSVAPDVGSGGQTLQISPLKPLKPKSGYLVIVTNRVTNAEGTPAVSDATYEQIKQGYLAGVIQLPEDPSQIDPDSLTQDQLLGLFVAAHLAVVDGLADAGLPISVENTVVTASFSTLSVTDALEYVDDTAAAQFSQIQQTLAPIDLPTPDGGVLPAGTPITTGIVLSLQGFDSQCGPTASFPLPGCGLVFAGAMNVPYYLTPPANQNDPTAVNSYWEGTAGVNPLDPESITLSRYNPIPDLKANLLIPVIMAVPGPNSTYVKAGGPKPPTGWPVVIFQHGVTRNRLDMFALAEGFNNAGVAVIAIDQPLHGITATDPAEDPTALFRIPGVQERTFDLDIANNANLADPTPDGLIDPSGVHYLNPGPDRLLPSGDHFRQTAADLIHLIRTVPTMDIDGDTNPDLDGSRIHFVGTSLGGLAGTLVVGVNEDFVSATLGVTGGCLSCGLFESPTFEATLGAGLVAALQANGILQGSTAFNNYLRDAQNLVDAGDALNYGLAWAGTQAVPVHLIEVQGDLVVPNSMTARLQLAMGLRQVPAAQPPVFPYPVFVGGPETGGVNGGLVFFTEGDHGSQLSPAASPAATVEMQTQQVVFAVGNPPAMIPGNGQVILVSNPAVVDVDGP